MAVPDVVNFAWVFVEMLLSVMEKTIEIEIDITSMPLTGLVMIFEPSHCEVQSFMIV